MDRFDRIYDLHKILSASRYPVSRKRLEDELECSRATVKRIIESMRLYLNAPIAYDRKLNGYYYETGNESGEVMYELPGIWFNASELQALLTVQQLLQDVQPGLFERQLAPLRERIDDLLQLQQGESGDLSGRIRILHLASRPGSEWFQLIAGATAQRRQLEIDYYARSSDTSSRRCISPQRLVHYRDNWYLDAWCHTRDALRTFSLDAIESARQLETAADDVGEKELKTHFTSAYGIFSGEATDEAVLHFSAESARWVANEAWHAQQQGEWLDSGKYQMRIPYANPTELVMDILRYGSNVEVIAPESLRQLVSRRLHDALAQYQ
ncbi:transcriptional regulator [Solemya velum gill symbiont]|uniref:helix-turn-helix transcriptional regulator n=1 Tax=Solemya velum gill symbiont TaxID=2340 RepID=UPI00099671C9|nr:WYL domain-containing transcriptional regulator [Solemya velum gill symbiont]OOZ49047.1 transcriptional regulator [Solemya velum gill symbiont]